MKAIKNDYFLGSKGSFLNAKNPAKEIQHFFDTLSKQYGFDIIPNEDSFYFIGNILGVARRLKSSKRYAELVALLELAVRYYPNSSMIHKKLSEAYKSANHLEKAGLSDKKSYKDSLNAILD